MDDTIENTASETLDALEIRLRRLEYLLIGNGSGVTYPSTDLNSNTNNNNQNLSLTVSTAPNLSPSEALLSLATAQDLSRENSIEFRLSRLDKQLNTLYNRVPVVKYMLDLQASLPELFPPPPSTANLPLNPNHHHQPTSLTIQEQLATIFPLSSKFHSVASQLLSITDSPIPNPHSSANLISLLPMINKIALLQEAQNKEVAELRARSIELLERWYLIGIEGVNGGFAECDERTIECDRVVSRKLRIKEQEEKAI